MGILIGLVGLLAVMGLAFLFSNDRKNINFKAVGIMLAMQVAVTLVMFKTTFGMKIVETVSAGFSKVMAFGMDGVAFVFADMANETSAFFFSVMLVIVFTATLLSILTHLRILPFAIKYLGGALSKITGLPKVETFNAINSIFFGQSEALLAVKSHLPKMDKNRLFMISTSAMASVSASIVGAYMTMIPAQFVLVAMILNALSALIVCSIIAPVKVTEEENEIEIKDMVQTKSIFDAISTGALDGGKVAVIVSAILIAYIALLSMVNAGFTAMFGMDLQSMLGYVFAPVAFIMGVPAVDSLVAGSIMGTKLVANEFVAMLQFQPLIASLSDKTVGIVSAFLTSFAAFSSIGIIGGTMEAINGAKAKEVSAFGMKMLLVATLSSIVSATMVGLFM